MATTKPQPAPAGPTPDQAKPAPAAARPDRTGSDEEMRRLLREAAWSRMFGKAGLKNPFTRRGG
jgi:hypothetical protein